MFQRLKLEAGVCLQRNTEREIAARLLSSYHSPLDRAILVKSFITPLILSTINAMDFALLEDGAGVLANPCNALWIYEDELLITTVPAIQEKDLE